MDSRRRKRPRVDDRIRPGRRQVTHPRRQTCIENQLKSHRGRRGHHNRRPARGESRTSRSWATRKAAQFRYYGERQAAGHACLTLTRTGRPNSDVIVAMGERAGHHFGGRGRCSFVDFAPRHIGEAMRVNTRRRSRHVVLDRQTSSATCRGLPSDFTGSTNVLADDMRRCFRTVLSALRCHHRSRRRSIGYLPMVRPSPTSPGQLRCFAFARDDDYFFGVLQSRFHEVWARAQGTQLARAGERISATRRRLASKPSRFLSPTDSKKPTLPRPRRN